MSLQYVKYCFWKENKINNNNKKSSPTIPLIFPFQLQNQEIMRVQLKRAEQEIGAKLAEALRRLEDPVQKQRVLVEEGRQKYLGLEERVLTQLG